MGEALGSLTKIDDAIERIGILKITPNLTQSRLEGRNVSRGVAISQYPSEVCIMAPLDDASKEIEGGHIVENDIYGLGVGLVLCKEMDLMAVNYLGKVINGSWA